MNISLREVENLQMSNEYMIHGNTLNLRMYVSKSQQIRKRN